MINHNSCKDKKKICTDNILLRGLGIGVFIPINGKLLRSLGSSISFPIIGKLLQSLGSWVFVFYYYFGYNAGAL